MWQHTFKSHECSASTTDGNRLASWGERFQKTVYPIKSENREHGVRTRLPVLGRLGENGAHLNGEPFKGQIVRSVEQLRTVLYAPETEISVSDRFLKGGCDRGKQSFPCHIFCLKACHQRARSATRAMQGIACVQRTMSRSLTACDKKCDRRELNPNSRGTQNFIEKILRQSERRTVRLSHFCFAKMRPPGIEPGPRDLCIRRNNGPVWAAFS
jgi:hypothetical protein